MGDAWLDVSIIRCPSCGRCYPDASWYAVELESDIECGECHRVFNTRNHLTDRVMLEFEIDDQGRVVKTELIKHIQE